MMQHARAENSVHLHPAQRDCAPPAGTRQTRVATSLLVMGHVLQLSDPTISIVYNNQSKNFELAEQWFAVPSRANIFYIPARM